MATVAAAATTMTAMPELQPARDIPITWGAGLRSWWSAGEKQSAASEERLLRKLSFFLPASAPDPSPAPPVTARISRVELGPSSRYINMLSMLPSNPAHNDIPTVMLHGYGAGLGFWAQNYDAIGKWAGKRGASVYSLDWLGMGRSARVPFKVTAKKHDIEGRVRQAEDFFVESLEEWRAKMGLEQMTLVGHSLGAYFSTVYALRYPTRVNRLVLVSPAGVPEGPNTTMPSREMEARRSRSESPSSSTEAVPATDKKVAEVKKEQEREKRQETLLRSFATYVWEQGWSPFQVVRNLTFYGPVLVGKYASRRFIGLTEEETRNFNDYILNITLAKGSGEYCVSHILAPFAHARMPLVNRITALKIPVTFIYGDHDWMDPEGGQKSVAKLREAGNPLGRMYIVPDAGHHIYLDNPPVFNNLLLRELDRDRL